MERSEIRGGQGWLKSRSRVSLRARQHVHAGRSAVLSRRRIFPSAKSIDPGEPVMSNSTSVTLPELEDRIAIARDNIRQLIEQAAAVSGAEDEDRNADRIAQQNQELERLVQQRDALLKK
jgi:hypothetical protein